MAILIFTVNTKRDQLWLAVPALESFHFGVTLTAIFAAMLLCIVYCINTVSTINMYSGTFMNTRVLPLPPHTGSGKSHRVYRKSVVDGLVRNSINNKGTDRLLVYLNEKRFKKSTRHCRDSLSKSRASAAGKAPGETRETRGRSDLAPRPSENSDDMNLFASAIAGGM